MPLSPTTLSDLIYAAWTSNPANGFSVPLSSAQQALVRALCDAVAASVVTHIMSAAVVTSTGPDAQGGTVTSVGVIT